MDLKKSKLGIFPKGIILHDSGQRLKVLSSIAFIKNRWIADVVDRKETFRIEKKPLKTIKKMFLKNVKLECFKRLVHRFRQKCKTFLTIIFSPNGPRKSMLRRST